MKKFDKLSPQRVSLVEDALSATYGFGVVDRIYREADEDDMAKMVSSLALLLYYQAKSNPLDTSQQTSIPLETNRLPQHPVIGD